MKLPRVRITVRRLMVVVAMVGTLLAIKAWSVRQAIRYSQLALSHQILSSTREQRRLHGTTVPDATWNAKKLWHRDMADKYERAARNPWLLVEPDTPEPS